MEAFLVFAEGLLLIGSIAEVSDEELEVLGFEETGNGLGFLAGDDNDRGREFQAAMGQIESEFVGALLGVETVGLSGPIDRIVRFGVYPDGIESVFEVFGDLFVGVGLFIHLFAPAAPGGVQIDKDGFLFLLEAG